MKWFDGLVAWLFPNILVEGTPWRGMWLEKERSSFVQAVKPFLLLSAIIYIAHYFFYDRPNDLQPIGHWLAFRSIMASLALLAFAYYLSSYTHHRFYRVPALLFCLAMCCTQAYVALWHSRESWVFCYILILACVLGLRMSALKSFAFAAVAIGAQSPILLQASIPVSYIFTGSMVTIGVALVVRASFLFEVRSFVLDQENIASQKKIIELNIEFADRIRSFIPRVIAQRIDRYMEEGRMNVLEASIEVLSPRRRKIACLFSDIRGFTRESVDLEEFLLESVLPEVKSCSDAIEDFEGIPRKVGDLIFAYFDGEDESRNILGCVCSAMAVSRINEAMNATANSRPIKRYVLVSCGDALVGNLGGLDSSIEITALGSPVNFLSRVDELTKSPQFAEKLRSGDLILSEECSRKLERLVPGLKQQRLELVGMGLTIRDFAEVRALYILPTTDSNFESLLRSLNADRPEFATIRSPGKVAA
jgi:class 3 adenylate cyclase